MFLALKEMSRAKVRFALLIGAVALLAYLILFQLTLQNALLRGFVGGVRNQQAPVLVFNVDGRRFLQGSSIDDEMSALVQGTEGVAAFAAIRQGTFPVTATDGVTRATSVLAYDDPALGAPRSVSEGRLPAALGEVLANSTDAERAYRLGDRITVAPTGLELTVVGRSSDVGLNVLPTLFTTTDTYLDVLRTRNPDATLPPPNALGVRPADGVSPSALAEAINARSPDIDALTRSAAADQNPGVQSIRQSFSVIFLLFGLVVPLVTGLFFLILTMQKAGTLTLLRALGASPRRLVAPLLAQVTVVLVAGLALGVALYALTTQARVGGLALRFESSAVFTWCAALAALGIVSALASIRRVLAIDPIAATTGAGVGR